MDDDIRRSNTERVEVIDAESRRIIPEFRNAGREVWMTFFPQCEAEIRPGCRPLANFPVVES
jgi:hypothetical protein